MVMAKKKRAWARTNNIVGHKHNFEINCRFCGVPMILRYSQLLSKKMGGKYGVTEATNQIAMKCYKCGWWTIFNVNHEITGYSEKSELLYLKKILKLRKNKTHYLPTTDEWKDESEEVRRQLEVLGYVGGR
jgi:hypothetical protein